MFTFVLNLSLCKKIHFKPYWWTISESNTTLICKSNNNSLLIHSFSRDSSKNVTYKEIVFFSWIPKETPESRQQYISALQSSDLTLSPVGMNTECYRIYEAMSLGSVPVVEDVVTPGMCVRDPPAPLRLLKELGAPVIWVSNWTRLEQVLENEQRLPFREKTERRIKVVKWYKEFKEKIKFKFVEVLRNKFL